MWAKYLMRHERQRPANSVSELPENIDDSVSNSGGCGAGRGIRRPTARKPSEATTSVAPIAPAA